MSASTLRDNVRHAINLLIGTHKDYLAERNEDEFGRMRYHQGVVAGLKMADEALARHYRDLHG